MIATPGYCSLLIVGDGEDEVYALHGRLERSESGDVFVQTDGGGRLPLEREWLSRAKAVTPDLEFIFGNVSKFFIPVSMGNLPEGATDEEYPLTGLKLPGLRRDA